MQKTFVIEHLGGATKAAGALGVGASAVSQWPDTLPDSAVGRIARLRPDLLRLWWRHQRTASKPGIRRNDTHGGDQ